MTLIKLIVSTKAFQNQVLEDDFSSLTIRRPNQKTKGLHACMRSLMNKTEQRQHLAAESSRYPKYLVEIPRYEWGDYKSTPPSKVWRSRYFLVQQYSVKPGIIRLSVNKTAIAKGFNKKAKSPNWEENITWEQLQEIKFQCGYGDRDAVEIYPKQKDVVNVSNMRHLFVYLDSDVDIAWRKND